MIYTVTFNPSLDYIVSVEDFKLGLTNRTSSELMLPGGKGINVSTVLGNLGIESTALGFLAGFTGKEIAGRLDQMGIKNGCIWLEEGYSRINVKLKSIDGTEINGQGPEIPEKKVEELMKQLSARATFSSSQAASRHPWQMMPIRKLWKCSTARASASS